MDRAAPALPFSSPSWLTPNRIALAAVAAFAAAAALPAVWWIHEARSEIGDHGPSMAVMMGTTAGLSVFLVWLALRARSMGNGVLWCALGGIAAGVLNAGLALGGVELVHRGDPGAMVGGFFLGTLFGGIYGGPLGLLFGTGYSIVAGSALRARLDPSHDGADRVMLTTGLWLALGGGLLAQAPGSAPQVLPPAWLVAGGAALAGVGLARRWGRQRWLARVAAGRDEAWQIEPRRGADEEAGLLPMLRTEGPSPEGVVVRRAAAKDPYRSPLVAAPVALATLPDPVASAAGDAGAEAQVVNIH